MTTHHTSDPLPAAIAELRDLLLLFAATRDIKVEVTPMTPDPDGVVRLFNFVLFGFDTARPAVRAALPGMFGRYFAPELNSHGNTLYIGEVRAQKMLDCARNHVLKQINKQAQQDYRPSHTLPEDWYAR